MPTQLLSHLLWRQRLMQTTASVALVTFTWLLLHPTVLPAQAQPYHPPPVPPPVPSDEVELAETLAHIEAKLIRLHERLTRREPTALEEDALAVLRTRLGTLDQQARQAFDRIAQHLQDKGLPDEILQRHQATVAHYETEMAVLHRHLDALAAASDETARQHAAVQTLQHLQTKQPRRPSRRFDPQHLPFRVPDGKVRQPKERKEEFESALFVPQPVLVASAALPPGLLAGTPVAALSATPTPDDLAPTEDVQLTDEITALAASLDNNPVAIYNWVHDRIEFVPTYGSIQGAHMTLQTQRGNAFDTASLLIALLRSANIPARYVYGTVQIPIAQVMNWVGGVTDPDAALQVLGQGGIPSTGLIQGGALVAVKLEHVWVEAWVDFVPSRGAKHVAGDTWVPMDAAFKQYQYTPGMNLSGNVPFDAPSFVAQVAATAQVNAAEGWVSGLDHTFIQNTLTMYQNQIDAYVAAQMPTVTIGDILGIKTVLPAQRPVLALGLPYQIVVRGRTMTALPESLRHRFRFALYATALEQLLDTPVVHFTQSLPGIAGKKFTLSFTPASQADADLLTSFLPQPPAAGSPLDLHAFPTSLPGYLIRLVAELRVESQVVARGGHVMLGQVLVSTASLYDPQWGWQEVENVPPVAGEYWTLAIDAAGIAASQLQTLQSKLIATQTKLAAKNFTELTADDLTGDVLYSVVLSYFAANEVVTRLSARAAGVVAYHKPSFGSFIAKAQPHMLFGVPRTVTFPGLELDITHLESIVVSRANNRVEQVAYVQQSGLWQSALEHVVPERLFTAAQQPWEAVSAVKALALAEAQGQRLYTITPDNSVSVLPQLNLAPDVTTEIQEATAIGKVVLVSQQEVTVGPWTGVGYIILDLETGAGAYQISGGANGARAFSLGATAGALVIVGILATVATMTATGPFIVPALSLLTGELAVVVAGFMALYEQVEPSERPCFWAGFNMVFAFAGLPGAVEALHLAFGFWAVPFLTGFALETGSPLKCVFGMSLPW